jgi:uncharacterized membrane protein
VNSDLIVMTFNSSKMAQTVHNSLQAMRKSAILGLDDSVIMTRDGAGQFRLHPGSQSSPGLAVRLADLILPSPKGVVPGVDGVKLDGGFVRAVVSALRNNSSALLIFLGSDSLSDRVELLNALALFRGTIHQTTLAPPGEALLRGMR